MESVSRNDSVDLSPTYDDTWREFPSELALDYWISGLARYVIADRLRAGCLTPDGDRIYHHAHGLFPMLDAPDAPRALPTINVVVTTERVLQKKGTTTAYYTYAAGIAVCMDGRLLAAGQDVDDLIDDLGRGKLATGIRATVERRQSVSKCADVTGDLQLLKGVVKAATNSNVRVFGCGASGQEDVMNVQAPPRLMPDVMRVKEIGPLQPPERMAIGIRGWAVADGPAYTAAANAYSAGLVSHLPAAEDLEVSDLRTALAEIRALSKL